MGAVLPEDLGSWHANWSAVSVCVVGLGEDGFAIADTLAELGATTHVVTTSPESDRQKILDVLDVSVHVAGSDEEIPALVSQRGCDLVVLAPSWLPEMAIEQEIWQLLPTVWSDVEFGWRVADKYTTRPDIVLVGGDDRASELADIAQQCSLHPGLRVARGGLGAPPVLDALRHPDGIDALIWTLSARQLWRMGNDPSTARRPLVSVGWDPDETLDVDLVMAVYTNTVESCLYQPGKNTQSALEQASVIDGARAIGIVSGTPGMSDLGRVENVIVDRAFLPDRKDRALELCTLDELLDAGFRSPEAIELAIGALGVSRALGLAPEVIGGALQSGPWPPRQ